jgi:DNA-binding HxlR family transcriptional regulator
MHKDLKITKGVNMPDFYYKGKLYYNPVEFALDWIGGSWKMPVLWRLKEKTLRYSEIKKTLPHISDKMLSLTLRELEQVRLIDRKVFAVVPPKTEYSLTSLGKKTIPVIEVLREFGISLMKEEGISIEKKIEHVLLKTREKKKDSKKKNGIK